MKILIIHPSVELYGADKILLYILQFLEKNNDITVLVPKEGILLEEIAKISQNIKILVNSELPIVHSKIGIKGFLSLPCKVHKFNNLFPKNTFDLVYCNTLATIMLLYNQWSNKKVIHVHEIIENKLLNLGFSILLKLKTKNVLCVSKHVKQNLYFSEDYYVLHNGIPDKYQCNIDAEIEKKKLSFVLPGRYMKKKGQFFLLETLKKIDKDILKNCSFLLYGSAPPSSPKNETLLATAIKENDLENVVKLCGFSKNISDIYLQGDVLLIPSLMADPFPTTVIESMMFCKPLITTNNGGASEIVKESFGILIQPNNIEEFKKAILFFINNKEKIKRMGYSARQEYLIKLTIETFQINFAKIMKEILEK